MENLEIRLMISDAGLKYKDVAFELGISQTWLSILMSRDLSEANWKRIVAAIARIKAREK